MFILQQASPLATQLKCITKAGKCLLCHNDSGIPQHTLRNILAIIEARSQEVIEKWQSFFGEARYYC